MKWCFFVDGMPFQGDTLSSGKSLGGSETAGLCMAREIAALGHDVFVFSRCEKEGIYDKVRYQKVERFIEWAQTVEHDVTVIQRIPQPFALSLASKVHLLWTHDLGLKRNQGFVRGALWNVSKYGVLVLSQFMKQQYRDVYGLTDESFFLTRNGIDLGLIDSAPGANPEKGRDRKAVIFTARPERGLDILLEETFPRLLKADPEIRLYLAGYDNYVPDLAPLYEKIQFLMQGFAGKARHVGALSKRDLYTLYKTMTLYIYPTDFEEVSCITAMECMATGLPMVCSANAALPETLHPEAGRFIPYEEGKGARDSAYQDQFAEACMELLNDRDKWEKASKTGKDAARNLGWDLVAKEWVEFIGGLL